MVGGTGLLSTLTITARANTTQTIDFDAGMGITAYSVTALPGQETLTNIVTTGLDFSFTAATGFLNVPVLISMQAGWH